MTPDARRQTLHVRVEVLEGGVKRSILHLAMLMMVHGAVMSVAFPQVPARRVETALPPAGPLPTWNPLPPTAGVKDEPNQWSIEARVLHFLQHLFGGPMPQALHSPFSNECGQRPCPYDLRN